MGAQNANNYGFKFDKKEQFINELTHNIPKPPKYFFYDAGLNQKGATSYDEALKKAQIPLTVEEFQKLRTQYKVVDTRTNIGKGTIYFIQALFEVLYGFQKTEQLSIGYLTL